MNMDHEQRKTLHAIYEWLRIREEYGTPMPSESRSFFVDAEHSSLLNRLLAGHRPLPEPPPRNMSYPWYDLVEIGHGRPYEVWEPKDQEHTGMLCIDQCFWRVVKKLGPTDWIVTYEYTALDPESAQKTYMQRSSESEWHLYSEGEVGGRQLWTLERLHT